MICGLSSTGRCHLQMRLRPIRAPGNCRRFIVQVKVSARNAEQHFAIVLRRVDCRFVTPSWWLTYKPFAGHWSYSHHSTSACWWQQNMTVRKAGLTKRRTAFWSPETLCQAVWHPTEGPGIALLPSSGGTTSLKTSDRAMASRNSKS